MNEQLQQQLAEYLKAIASTAQQGASFVMEQAPLVVQEKIALGRVTLTAWMVLCVVACVPLVRFGMSHWGRARAICKEQGDAYYRDEEVPHGLAGGLSVACGCACVIAALALIEPVATVWFAPRLYILEWAMGLVSGGK